jgi:hypothetical protein
MRTGGHAYVDFSAGTGYLTGMITLLVEADASTGERLTRTLTAMIPAIVEGAVRDAVILNADGSSEIEAIADAAGATCIPSGDIAAAVDTARGDWLLCLEPGARPEGEWYDTVLDALAATKRTPAGPARFRAAAGGGLLSLFRRPRALRCGLIIHKRQAAAAKAKSLEALANGRSARRLNARLVPAEG